MRDMRNKLKPCKKIVQTSKKVQGQTEDNFTLMLTEEFLPIEVLWFTFRKQFFPLKHLAQLLTC